MSEYELIFQDENEEYIDDLQVTMPDYFEIWEVGINMMPHFPKAKSVLVNRIEDGNVLESMIITVTDR